EEFTELADRKVRGSSLAPASRPLLSRIVQPGQPTSSHSSFGWHGNWHVFAEKPTGSALFDISDISIRNALFIRLLKILRQPTTGFALLGAHQNIRLTETREMRLPDEPQEGRNRSWAVEELSAALWVVQIIEQGSKTLICISFTKLNIRLLLERVFLNFSGYSLTFTQMQANATKRLHKFRNRSHFSRDAKRIYEKIYYSHASAVLSTVTLGQSPSSRQSQVLLGPNFHEIHERPHHSSLIKTTSPSHVLTNSLSDTSQKDFSSNL
ncbi:hypothetical protein CSKR_108937, partial [Clonorchis sinensis]